MAAVSQPQLRPMTSWMSSMRGAGALFIDDIFEEDGALLCRRPGAERLLDGDDVIVDGLGQADDGELVVVLAR